MPSISDRTKILVGALVDATRHIGWECNEKCGAPDKFRCCIHCESEYGYLPKVPKELKKMYKNHFGEHGFWREDLPGCNLPVEYRSPLCLGYYCRDISDNMRVNDLILLTALYDYNRFIKFDLKGEPWMFQGKTIEQAIKIIQDIKNGYLPKYTPIPSRIGDIVASNAYVFPKHMTVPPYSLMTLGEVFDLRDRGFWKEANLPKDLSYA